MPRTSNSRVDNISYAVINPNNIIDLRLENWLYLWGRKLP